MKNLRKWSCLAGALALGGCATLEQAPLVYTSKTSFGVDISTTSTETPGLSMSVGFKQVDAAYVPVAVSKACQTPKNNAKCDPTLHRVEIIGGKEQLGDTSADAKAADAAAVSETLRKQLNSFISAADRARIDNNKYDLAVAQKAALDAAWRKKQELATQSARLTQLQYAASASTSTDADRDAASEQQKKVDALKLSTEEAAATANISNDSEYRQAVAALATDSLRRDAEQSKNAAEEQFSRFKLTKEALTNRGDSYSVFGSFENKNSGGREGASVSLGKIFATGVASQSISRGLEKRYQQPDSIACYDALKSISGIDKDRAADLLQQCIKLSQN